jgi:hypothetical protein
MTIAYLILCHTDPKHIRRLTEKITKDTNDVAFVHVDGKCDLIPFQCELKDNSQVQLLKKRTPVNWGGYSSIEATINLFKAAISWRKQGFDRFVILQGLEYPIKTNQEIHNFFEEKPKKNIFWLKIYQKLIIQKRSISIHCTGILIMPLQ